MTPQSNEAMSDFPGAELVLPGLDDLAAGRLTIGSCLVSMARPNMDRAGLTSSLPTARFVLEPERTLYRLLQAEGGNAYGRYNSLRRRLVKFERALRHRASGTHGQASVAS
ncbi:MAG: hypothetical protein ABR589_08535 [Chthoniobacterales bacterium]